MRRIKPSTASLETGKRHKQLCFLYKHSCPTGPWGMPPLSATTPEKSYFPRPSSEESLIFSRLNKQNNVPGHYALALIQRDEITHGPDSLMGNRNAAAQIMASIFLPDRTGPSFSDQPTSRFSQICVKTDVTFLLVTGV